MYGILPRCFNKNKKITNAVALAVLICLVAAFLLSITYIVANAGHDHKHYNTDGECDTCAHIKSAENLFNQLASAINIIPVLIALLSFLTVLYKLVYLSKLQTLINLKVQMNN